MRLLILGTTWADGEPRLRVRAGGTESKDAKRSPVESSVLEPVRGFRLGYRVPAEPTRRCIGHTPFRRGRGDYHDCGKDPEAGTRRCERCTIVEATFASNLHHAHTRGSAELDPAVAEHLSQPNQLYLAAFRDGSLKIGTTTMSRRDTRLAEQGAWRALIVADADDGYIVREIEDAVTRELALAQAVNVRRKIAGLVSPLPDEELESRLADAATEVHRLVADMGSPRLRALDPPAPWVNSATETLASTKVHSYPLKLDQGTHDLVLTDAVGRVSIAQRSGGDDRFAIDLQALFGVELELGDFGSDEIAIQDSLF